MKAKLKADKEKSKRRKQRGKERKKDISNHNYVKFDGLITKSIMKDVAILPGSSASMTSEFRNFKKSAVAYAESKSYKYWPGCY